MVAQRHGWPEIGPNSEALKERRTYHRRSVACLLNFQLEGRERFPASIGVGRIVDISKSGVRLETNQELQVGLLLRLEVALEQTLVHATARVVHASPLESGLCVVGAEFSSVGEKDQAALCCAPAQAS